MRQFGQRAVPCYACAMLYIGAMHKRERYTNWYNQLQLSVLILAYSFDYFRRAEPCEGGIACTN